ncbi:tRNA lysidine(34) synthetase TilS [Candidatus Saccharibacteria bacterium]|nr:tRNA lysidine(34) synthetase TilS [Candidatus Saccharibacteria bacterium]
MDIAKTIRLAPGRYVVAVSGGVDSMVLLDLLTKLAKNPSPSTLHPQSLSFIVAHFDHGIREASHIDRKLVHEVSLENKLPFVYKEGNLGSKASEAAAREARYDFLRKVQKHAGADGIITAHHLDDSAETAVLNLLRGTGRKGLASLKAGNGIYRPLLNVPKGKLRAYAEANGLKWNEDITNQDTNYRRNHVRHNILKKLKESSPEGYHRLLTLIRRQRDINHAVDQQLQTLLHIQPSRKTLRRRDVIALPYAVSCELVAQWLRENGKRQLSRWLVEHLTVAIRTAQPDTELLVDAENKITFKKHTAEFRGV